MSGEKFHAHKLVFPYVYLSLNLSTGHRIIFFSTFVSEAKIEK